MPLRINLLAEAQAAEEMRRKDPVKRAIWIAVFVVSLVLLWSLSLQFKIFIARSDLRTCEQQWKVMEKDCTQVEQNRKRIRELEQRLSAYDQFTTNRFLWANVLNDLQHAMVDNVQLLRLRSEQTYFVGDSAKANTNNLAAARSAANVATERIAVALDAKDYSPRAADQVTRFKENLATLAHLQSTLQKTNGVLLTSLSAPQFDGTRGGRAFVVFSLELNFQEKQRRLYE